ncbi:hypothetical protein [Streptomyces sp. AD55]|uniref:hypothetical protein n=1 Tax=Streptomyces sp. AD55 TaxID=3242895 RepID=UPI0035278FD1
MTTWGLIVETTVGFGERKHTEAYVVAHFTGSREEAFAELERRARRHTPEHPMSPKRRRLLRWSDGFLLVVDGAWQSFVTRFTVAELLADSDTPVAEEPAVVEQPIGPAAPEPVAAQEPGRAEPVAQQDEWYADGVPVKPSWLGREDLP